MDREIIAGRAYRISQVQNRDNNVSVMFRAEMMADEDGKVV